MEGKRNSLLFYPEFIYKPYTPLMKNQRGTSYYTGPHKPTQRLMDSTVLPVLGEFRQANITCSLFCQTEQETKEKGLADYFS